MKQKNHLISHKLILVLVYLLVFNQIVFASPQKKGWALLAIQHKKFPCRSSTEVAKIYKKPYIAYLDSTFGRKTECLAHFISEAGSKKHFLQVYVSNEVCRRKGNCQRGDFLKHYSVNRLNYKLSRRDIGLEIRFKNRFRRILLELLAISSPNTKIRISPGLESQYTSAASITLSAWLLEVGWLKKQMILNQVGNAKYQGYAGYGFKESHSSNLRTSLSYGGSLDGECNSQICNCVGFSNTSNQASLNKFLRNKKADYLLAWCPKHQGLSSVSTIHAPPPRKRNIRVPLKDIKNFKSEIHKFKQASH